MPRRISKYFPPETLAKVGEDVVEQIVKEVLLPGIKQYVKETENKWDDTVVAMVEPILLELVERIDKND